MKHTAISLKHLWQQGYSLIELSITLALIGVMVGTGLSLAGSSKEKTYIDATAQKMDEIEEALRRFVVLHNRLPCPASPTAALDSANFGMEDNCAGADPALAGISQIYNGVAGGVDEVWIGALPTRTLGLSDSYAYDKWNSRFTYAAYKSAAATGTTFNTFAVSDVSRMIYVQNEYNQNINLDDITNPIAYVLISHGKDRKGAYSQTGTLIGNCSPASNSHLDVTNCEHTAGTLNSIFRDMEMQDSSIQAQYFMDILRWKTKMTFGEVALP